MVTAFIKYEHMAYITAHYSSHTISQTFYSPIYGQ